MKRPIYNMLYTVKDRQSLHMPAHHGEALFSYDVLSLDTTEFSLTDNLYQPNGPIAEAQERLAQSADVDSAFFLHNGSSAGIHAMLLYAKHRGDKVIVQRNSHISVYHFAAVLDLNLVYIKESYSEEGIPFIAAEDAVQTIKKHADACAILLTSPNYYGVCIDFSSIHSLTKELGMLLLVDQAHGAHLNWASELHNAGYYGADIFVQSAHKTLPCTTSCAWLLSKNQDKNMLQKCLQTVQTSSPSFINMLQMDDARAYMDAHADFSNIIKQIESFGKKIESFGYRLSLSALEQQGHIVDKTRLTLYCPQGGYFVQDALAENGIDVEMADDKHIVCILSPILKRCKQELQTLYFGLVSVPMEGKVENHQCRSIVPKKNISLHRAYFLPTERVSLEHALGRTSAAVVAVYPPGTPVIVWGEIFSKQVLDEIQKRDSHQIVGLVQNKVSVVKE